MEPDEINNSSNDGIPNCELEFNYREESQQLSCICQELTSIPEMFFEDEFTKKTKRLDFSLNNLRNIDGIENFRLLEELTLDNNDLRHTVKIPHLENLHTLMINKNCIDKLEPFIDSCVENLPSLTYLSLLGNKACPNQLSSIDNDEDDYARYRIYLIYKIPKLKFIDATPVTDRERKDAEQKGQFLSAVVRPMTNEPLADKVDTSNPLPYHPLPASGNENSPVGTFGTCKYIYYGRHSEGNRFIRNNDL